MIMVKVYLPEIGNPELFLYPRPWLMSALIVRLLYPCVHLRQPPYIYPNLSISRELFWNLTPAVCRKLRHCHARTCNEKQEVEAR